MKGVQTGRASRLSLPDKLEENAPSPWHQTKFCTKQNFHQRREATTNRAVHSWSGSSNNTRPVQYPDGLHSAKIRQGRAPANRMQPFFHSSSEGATLRTTTRHRPPACVRNAISSPISLHQAGFARPRRPRKGGRHAVRPAGRHGLGGWRPGRPFR